MLTEENRYDNESIKHLKEDYPDIFGKLEEALLKYMAENDHKFLKHNFLISGIY